MLYYELLLDTQIIGIKVKCYYLPNFSVMNDYNKKTKLYFEHCNNHNIKRAKPKIMPDIVM